MNPYPTLRPACAGLLLLVLALGAPGARAEGDETAVALAAGKSLRSRLAAPKTPLAFEGDLQVAGEKAGTVRWSAEPTTRAGQPVWLVQEEDLGDFGGTQTRHTATLTLGKDLSLLEGRIALLRGEDRFEVDAKRTGASFRVTRRVTRSGEAPQESTETTPVAAGATYGRVALLLLVRSLPAKPAVRYAVPWFDPLDAILPKDEHTVAEGDGPLLVEPRGDGRFEEAGPPRDSYVVAFRRGDRTFDLHVEREGRAPIGIVGGVPRHHVVPAGTAGAATAFDDDAPARSWKAAFLKFGHGYHMGKREWLDAAFHWPTWYEHSTQVAKDWPSQRPVEAFRSEWIDAFLSSSPHRSRAEADRLLQGTLETGRVTEKSADRVVFAADAAYGGGVQRTYHFREIDRVWYIVRIDSAE